MARIRLTLKDKILREIPLNKDAITIGRSASNDIHIDNRSVSRFHAKIIKLGGQFYIEDLKSTNGTFVNDKKVSWRDGLNNNDKITIGKYALIYIEEKQETGQKARLQKTSLPGFDSTIIVPKKNN